ncbi:MAG: hypothetical protein RLZZ524_3102 [Pseudomonadota bacterium]|jgi:tape measure domain-containing protein
MADLTKTVSIIFQGDDQITVTTDKIAKTFTAVGAEAEGATTDVGKLGTEVEDLGKKSAGIDTVTTALKALAASLIVKAFIDANVEAEKFERTMTLLKGSSAAAAEEFDYISGFAQQLGLDLFSTANAYAQLSAATLGTVLEGKATRDVFEAVSRAMAALGKSSGETEGALLAVSQMVSKGTVSAEELRGQLGERLPGAFQVAANAVGVTTEELGKLLQGGKIIAEDFLPKFADELNKTFGGASFDGYVASMNNLRTAISLAFIDLGNAGAFDALIVGVNAVTAILTGAISAIRLFGETFGNFAYSVNTGDWSGFGDRFREALDKAAGGTKSLIDALAGTEDQTKDVATAGKDAGDAIADGMAKGAASATDMTKASAEVDKALKALGIDPKIFDDPIKLIVEAFQGLATNVAASGEQIIVGLVGALQNLPAGADLGGIEAALNKAFESGKLSADDFSVALELLKVKQDDLSPSFTKTTEAADKQTDSMKKTANETKKAEEAAQKFAIEMEKIASNERIKNIEAVVTLKVADLEAQTERIKAAFSSIDNTVNSTADLIGDLFGVLANATPNTAAFDIIERQLDLENKRREEALDLQKKLTEAQIEEIKARTTAMQQGEGIIKIDGAGLQPHLEAFMWEILKTIQVRVNADGLAMLLGV